MKKLLLILLCLPLIGFSQWQLPAAFTGQADPVNIMRISFTTDTAAVMSNPSGGDTLIIDNWEWDFGDGTTDTIQNPIHSYVTYGNYTVCLTVGGFPTNGNLIYYTFINCDTFTYSPSGWAKIGQITTIKEHTTNKKLLKITDILGRETKGKKNEPLFYIYDDGLVEKKIILE